MGMIWWASMSCTCLLNMQNEILCMCIRWSPLTSAYYRRSALLLSYATNKWHWLSVVYVHLALWKFSCVYFSVRDDLVSDPLYHAFEMVVIGKTRTGWLVGGCSSNVSSDAARSAAITAVGFGLHSHTSYMLHTAAKRRSPVNRTVWNNCNGAVKVLLLFNVCWYCTCAALTLGRSVINHNLLTDRS